jgi:hypothetical protein
MTEIVMAYGIWAIGFCMGFGFLAAINMWTGKRWP